MQERRFAQQIRGTQTAKDVLGAVAKQLLKSKFELIVFSQRKLFFSLLYHKKCCFCYNVLFPNC
jgi:hypothetical protein